MARGADQWHIHIRKTLLGLIIGWKAPQSTDVTNMAATMSFTMGFGFVWVISYRN